MGTGLSEKKRRGVMPRIRRRRHDRLEGRNLSRSTNAMSILMYRWEHLPWETIERQVYKLQKRIYQASLRDDTKAVHTLQRLLMHCWSAKCLAVRRVTQDNQGKNTTGIDGIKRLSPNNPIALLHPSPLDTKTPPLRHSCIP